MAEATNFTNSSYAISPFERNSPPGWGTANGSPPAKRPRTYSEHDIVLPFTMTNEIPVIYEDVDSQTHSSDSVSHIRDDPCYWTETDKTLAQPGVTYNFINNELLLSKSATWTKVLDPVTQNVLTRVPESRLSEVQHAVAAAAAAQPAWAALTPANRSLILLDMCVSLKAHRSDFTFCLFQEVGKTMQDAETEFERGVDAITSACAIIGELKGTFVSGQTTTTTTCTFHEPLGVCVAVTPFNFPFMIPLWSIPYALITGNTMVLKPSERTPTAAMMLAACAVEAGLPPGVLNIVHGGASAVNVLLSQPAVMAVNFVGSDIVGERVHDHARANKKRVQAECGGKNHGVVMPDADSLQTLYAIAGSAFGAAGQRCMSLTVAIFVGSAKEWIGDLVDIASSLAVGAIVDPVPGIGPLISVTAKERVIDIINSAEADGAQVLLDGRKCVVEGYPDGNFVGPTILTGVETFMQCYQEEIFGPVLCCFEVETLDEAIDMINENRYGNGCTIFTGSPQTAKTFEREVNVGQIGVNVPVIAPSGTLLRTCNKDSFLGDMCGDGRGSWQFYTVTKTSTSLWR